VALESDGNKLEEEAEEAVEGRSIFQRDTPLRMTEGLPNRNVRDDGDDNGGDVHKRPL